jgi:hypothetical protein
MCNRQVLFLELEDLYYLKNTVDVWTIVTTDKQFKLTLEWWTREMGKNETCQFMVRHDIYDFVLRSNRNQTIDVLWRIDIFT